MGIYPSSPNRLTVTAHGQHDSRPAPRLRPIAYPGLPSFADCRGRILLALCLSGVNPAILADTRPSLSIHPIARSAAVHIRASQVSLTQLLDQITRKTGIKLHLSATPPALRVSGDCTGNLVGEVLECLIGLPVNMVVRFSPQHLPEEAWLLSVYGDETGLPAAPPPKGDLDTDLVESDDLIELAQSKNPAQRAEAIDNMAAGEISDPQRARQVLTDALKDSDPTIRAKAVRSLASIAGKSVAGELREMLADSDAAVRLATVTAAYNQEEILRQAQTDSSEQVRSAAEINLSRIARSAGAQASR